MLLVFAGSGFAVETGVQEAAEDFPELRPLWDSEGEEVVAGEVGAFVPGFREVVEEAVSDG